MKPNLKLKIDEKEDIHFAKLFLKYGENHELFFPPEFWRELKKEKSVAKKNKMIAEFAKPIYKSKKKEIVAGVKKTKREWSKVEDKFYSYVDNFFLGHQWPKGKYTGLASIFNMYPKWIEGKFFTFPYNNSRLNPLETIAHEMKHFIFYDYIRKKYGVKEFDIIKGDPKYVWKISESFNHAVENLESYKKNFKATEDIEPYPGCEKIYKKMKKQLEKDSSVKILDNWF